MMNYVNGKRMEESDLCIMLQDMGVILDRPTWTTMKDAFKASQVKPVPNLIDSKLSYFELTRAFFINHVL